MSDKDFLIYRSSAGSGKTFALVREYLRLALPNGNFKDILAITFTNKAANEMKVRILKEIHTMADLSNIQEEGMSGLLCHDLNYTQEKLAIQAKKLEHAILHHYADFSICTIDSFMHKIVRTFAHDLNIPINFEVLLDQKKLIQYAIEELISKVGVDEGLTDILLSFAESQMDQGIDWKIERKIASLSMELFKEDTPEYLNRLKDISLKDFKAIYSELMLKNREFEEYIYSIGRDIFNVIETNGLSENDFNYGSTGVYGYFKRIFEKDISKIEPGTRVQKLIFEKKLAASKSSQQAKDTIERISSFVCIAYEKIQQLLGKEYKSYCSRKLLIENLYSLAVLNSINEIITNYSTENEVLHISEFNKRISKVVFNEPIPFLYERIGEKYKHYLIDEFQDTSVLQWQNLLPLVTEGLSAHQFSLVVGDGKQAIYRFRQGEVEQFIKLPSIICTESNAFQEERGRILERTSEIRNLDTNYRSKDVIVAFNNTFFTYVMQLESISKINCITDIYIGEDKEKPQVIQKSLKAGGFVSINLLQDQEDEDVIAENIFKTIENLIVNQGFRYKDIAILARTRKELTRISQYLQQQTIDGKPIPIISSESFILANNREVVFLITLLRLLHNPHDKVSQLLILEYLNDRQLLLNSTASFFLKNTNNADFIQHLASEGFSLNIESLTSMTLYDCCEMLIRIFKLQDISISYIATFLNTVATYSSRNRQNIGEFLDWIDEKIETLSSKTSDDLDATTLMTVHKSKGLEFPIVLYPVYKPRPKSGNLWVTIADDSFKLPVGLLRTKKDMATSTFSKEYDLETQKALLDDINVLYVALTRAEQKLFIFTNHMNIAKNDYNSINYTLLLNLFIEENKELFIEHEIKNGSSFSMGENCNATNTDKVELTNTKMEISHLVSSDWTEKIFISEHLSKALMKTSAIQDPIVLGLRVHELLSHIHSWEDVDKILQDFVMGSSLIQEEIEVLRKRINSVVNGKETAMFFDPKYNVKTECEVMYKGQILRPDRIVFMPETTWVVDFKTGSPSISHNEQIENYKSAVSAMGYSNVKGYLLYC